MILQPRKHVYKTKQKLRSKTKYSHNFLTYGAAGLLINQPLQLTSKQIFRINILLKQSTRKSEKTKRTYWFNVFPHLPLTRKTKGSRMGKGVGKLKLWFTSVSAGKILIEFKNLRQGRFFYFYKRLDSKFKVFTKPTYNSTKNIKLTYSSRTNVSLNPFFLKV
jgi:large subunit ribosomal protein L16